MPKVKKPSGAKVPASHPVGNGAVVKPPQASPTTGTTTTKPGVVAEASTTGSTGLDILGWFTVDDEGCTVRFGIEQQQYLLAATAPNYNAMFSTLLACWLDRRRVDLTYALPLIGLPGRPDDAPLRILSLATI
jgi:hypothetical protein